MKLIAVIICVGVIYSSISDLIVANLSDSNIKSLEFQMSEKGTKL